MKNQIELCVFWLLCPLLIVAAHCGGLMDVECEE